MTKDQPSPEHTKGTGSIPSQTVLLTKRIEKLTKHFSIHKKDLHSMRGLIQMVSRRKKLLSYIKRTDEKSYQNIVKELSLRK